MEVGVEEESDLQLVRASASLLADLETSLPKLWWKRANDEGGKRRSHKHVKKKDLDYIISLIEPFQGDPQLLDSKLKSILPEIVNSYLHYIRQNVVPDPRGDVVDLELATMTTLYTLCKVRGTKVIVGFLNNEPRHLEPILARLDRITGARERDITPWQVSYVLLLWLSHLLLAPFDLASIASHNGKTKSIPPTNKQILDLPEIAVHVLEISRFYLQVPTKAQDAAAAVLIRLAVRPDMQKLGLAQALVSSNIQLVRDLLLKDHHMSYQHHGPLRVLAGIAASSDLSTSAPEIYRFSRQLAEEEVASEDTINAVTKKLLIKILRNVAILLLRDAKTGGFLSHSMDLASVLESAIEYFLDSLSAKDSPVRFAAAKAISLIVLELETETGYEVIQAVLDMFKEDMLSSANGLDFRTANALKWHGLTLTLAHSLFKRTASPAQLPDILNALVSALQFDQRTATGSSLGTNVRDAANFGIWSVARRYTTSELKAVEKSKLGVDDRAQSCESVIHYLALELILSSCLDPSGNIRRGSSAALQEVIGRHPNEVPEGISLVQIVDYSAVGLRARSLVSIAAEAANSHSLNRLSLTQGLLGWRGLESQDTSSRAAAAQGIAKLEQDNRGAGQSTVLEAVISALTSCPSNNVEQLHGLTMTISNLINKLPTAFVLASLSRDMTKIAKILKDFERISMDYSSRSIRADLPSAIVAFVTSLIGLEAKLPGSLGESFPWLTIDAIVQSALQRHEETVINALITLFRTVKQATRYFQKLVSSFDFTELRRAVASDNKNKDGLYGAGRVIALGMLTSPESIHEDDYLVGDELVGADLVVGANVTRICSAVCIQSLDRWAVDIQNVDRRALGLRAIELMLRDLRDNADVDGVIIGRISDAIVTGMQDYTIDQRGDIGSLARLQAIACSVALLEKFGSREGMYPIGKVKLGILRLSLEKLDRVRLHAAKCRQQYMDLVMDGVNDISSVSDHAYFLKSLAPLIARQEAKALIPDEDADGLISTREDEENWTALLYGCASCGGIAAEALIQASRSALVDTLCQTTAPRMAALLNIYSAIMKQTQEAGLAMQPLLEQLAFVLSMGVTYRLGHEKIKWRTILSVVQKSHYQSSDIGKIQAAVQVYRELVHIPQVRNETLKKLFSMLATNPYPRVRLAVLETLYMSLDDRELSAYDWTVAGSHNKEEITRLRLKYLVE